MKKLFLLSALLVPASAFAAISGPVSSADGNFTLSWSAGTVLREVSSAGAVLNTWTGTSASIRKPDSGTYYFQEVWCGTIPFSGETCVATDTHEVYVDPSGTSYPQSLSDQAAYDYQIRSGDFDSDGRTDLLVERLSPGPADGTLQSYIVWNNSNGTISTTALNGSPHATTARSASVNATLNLLRTDINADGYVDHIIERVDQVMGSDLQQELAVFAPGAEPNKSRPQGNRQVDANFRTFFIDLARWMNSETYFSQNISTTRIPIFAFGYACATVFWYSTIFGLLDGGYCYPYVYVVGYRTVEYGVNFSALSASTYMARIPEGGRPALNDLWQISQIARGVIGVHLFGFDASGNRRPTNHDGDELDQRADAFWTFAFFAMAMARDESDSYPKYEHDFTVETEICRTSLSWCTLANIACWGRHYHAPDKKEGYDEPVKNGGRSTLKVFGTDNPIRTGVGEAAKLPANATGNITEEGHWFHNDEMGGWGTCPKTVPDQGSGTPPTECNQVYREPYIQNGKVFMRTRGTGENRFDWANQFWGPGLFEDLDEMMKQAILNDADHLCPSL